MKHGKDSSSSAQKPSLLLGLLGILSVFFGAWFFSKILQKTSKTPHPQNSTSDIKTDTPSFLGGNMQPTNSTPENHHSSQSNQQTPLRKIFYEWGVGIGTLGLLVINIFLWCTTNNSVEFAKRSFELGQEPRISIGRADGTLGEFVESKKPDDWTDIVVYLKNSGRLPAMSVCVATDINSPFVTNGQHHSYLWRSTGTKPPNSFYPHGSNCPTIGGESIYAYVLRALPPGTFKLIRAADHTKPLTLSMTVEYCTTFGKFSARNFTLQYDPPTNLFDALSEYDMSNFYGRFENPSPFIPLPDTKYLLPCEQPGEAQQRANDEAEYWRTHPAPKAPPTK